MKLLKIKNFDIPVFYSTLSGDFETWFVNTEIEPKECKLESIIFPSPLKHEEINECHPTDVSFNEMIYTLGITETSRLKYFYVKDKNGIVRLITANFDKGMYIKTRVVKPESWWLFANFVENYEHWERENEAWDYEGENDIFSHNFKLYGFRRNRQRFS